MVRINVSLIVEESEKDKALVDAAMELVEFSLRDKGCIGYDLLKSLTNDDRYMIVETWESLKDLEAHKNTEHFKRLVPQLQDLATMTSEQFNF